MFSGLKFKISIFTVLFSTMVNRIVSSNINHVVNIARIIII